MASNTDACCAKVGSQGLRPSAETMSTCKTQVDLDFVVSASKSALIGPKVSQIPKSVFFTMSKSS